MTITSRAASCQHSTKKPMACKQGTAIPSHSTKEK